MSGMLSSTFLYGNTTLLPFESLINENDISDIKLPLNQFRDLSCDCYKSYILLAITCLIVLAYAVIRDDELLSI